MNFVYLAFGDNLTIYKQVCFSIYTALIHKNQADRIVVVTDRVCYFQHLKQEIEFIVLDKDLIEQWQKANNGFFRIKIKAMEAASLKYPLQDLLYLDGDTYIFNDLAQIRRELSKGQNFMHVKELKLSDFVTQSQKQMWMALKDKEFDGIAVDETSYMWNAGAVAICKEDLTFLQQVVKVNDQMCEHLDQRYFVEQFAFSVVLANIGVLKPLDNYIGHYWGNKSNWEQRINQLLIQSYLKDYTLEQVLQTVKQMDLTDLATKGRQVTG